MHHMNDYLLVVFSSLQGSRSLNRMDRHCLEADSGEEVEAEASKILRHYAEIPHTAVILNGFAPTSFLLEGSIRWVALPVPLTESTELFHGRPFPHQQPASVC